MSLSPFARQFGLFVVCWLAAVPAVVVAETFPSQGSEYSVTGSMHGDQVMPSVSVNAGGGYVVWQGNEADGAGWGIRGVALDKHFVPTVSPFRVNLKGAAEQEKPQVALLRNGGAVFVWQGGKLGFQHIYARFLSPSNTWVGGDILVNSVTNRYQRDAAVTVLADGNVLVAWASFNQRSSVSMQDVYGQIFSPTGQKIGGEFALNEDHDFNQRSVSVASLPSGGFVAAWISEEFVATVTAGTTGTGNQFVTNLPMHRVNVKLRLFDAAGVPAGSELTVNGNNRICANPAVASGPDSGFVIAWSEKDIEVRNNSWDIRAATFSSLALKTSEQYVNTQLYGDQFAPRIASLGSDFFVVWTSLLQDGSREGVFGQFLQADGGRTGGEVRVNTTVAGRQFHPAVGADNYGRFLVGWSGYAGRGSSYDVYAQRYAMPGFVPAADPEFSYGAPEFVPEPTEGSVFTTNNVVVAPGEPAQLSFPGAEQVVAPPSGDLFLLAQGTYNGLFYDPSGLDSSSSGYFSAKVTSSGAFSGKITLGGKKYSVSGQFNAEGKAEKTIARKGLRPLHLTMQLGGDQIRGQVSDSIWTADLIADRVVFGKTNPATGFAGKYTVVIPGNAEQSGSPSGDGYGTATISSSGVVSFAGVLADGTKVSQGGTISKDGVWAVYLSLSKGAGLVIGWIDFAEEAESSVEGQVIWIRKSGSSAAYPSGFTSEIWVTGSSYTPPPAGTRVLNLSSGYLKLKGAGLALPLSRAVQLDANNKVVSANGAQVSVTITTSSGLFKGKVLNPDTGQTLSIQGALLQNGNMGTGFFLNSGKSGNVILNSAP